MIFLLQNLMIEKQQGVSLKPVAAWNLITTDFTAKGSCWNWIFKNIMRFGMVELDKMSHLLNGAVTLIE